MLLFSRWAVMHLLFGHRYSPVCATRRCLCRHPLSSQPIGRSQVPIRNPLLLLQLYNHLTSAFVLSLHLIFFLFLPPSEGFFCGTTSASSWKAMGAPAPCVALQTLPKLWFFFCKTASPIPFQPPDDADNLRGLQLLSRPRFLKLEMPRRGVVTSLGDGFEVWWPPCLGWEK